MPSLRTVWLRSLEAISDDQLDEIAADGHTFARTEWYRLLDRAPLSDWTGGDVALGYVAVFEGERPVALCPVFRTRGRGVYFAYSIRRYYFEHWIEEARRSQPVENDSFARLRAAINGYRRVLDWSRAPLDEALIVTSPLSVRSLMAVSPSAESSRARLHDAIITCLQRYSRSRRLPLWFLGVSGETSRLSESLARHGFQRTFLLHDNVIDLENYQRFGDYLQSFRRSTRRALHREATTPDRLGVEFQLVDDVDRVADEIAEVDARSQGRLDDSRLRQPSEFWSHLGRSHGHKAEVILARYDDRILGFHVLLRNDRRGEMWSYRVGRILGESSISRAMAGSLLFHEPIRRAIALGYRRIWLGPMGYESKTLRGARQVPIYSHFWFPRHCDRWLLAPYLEEFGKVTREQIARSLDRPARLKAALKQAPRRSQER